MNRRNFLKTTVCFSLLSLAALKGISFHKNSFSNSDTEEKIFPYIEVHLADHCNLNCKYCSHFSPIADKKFYDLKLFEKDISRLSKITKGNIELIRLMGGEPLLNPDIDKYMYITRNNFPKSIIGIVTNGILLKNMDNNFWKALRENKILLIPSVYKIDIDWQLIFKRAKEEDVEIIWCEEKIKESDYFINMALDLTASQKNLMKCNMKECFTAGCYNLYEGKIFVCPVVAYVKYFNKKFNQNVKVSNTDYIDIYKIRNIDEIINWTKKPKNFCKYCGDWYTVLWEPSLNHTIDEWAKV